MRVLSLALSACILGVPFALAQQTTSTGGGTRGSSLAASYHTVKPGDCHNNGDVNVCNRATSSAKIKVTPKQGTAGSSSQVDFENRANGSVDGLDANDTVNVTSRAEASITGTGGTVNVSGSNASATITNNAPPGGGNIT